MARKRGRAIPRKCHGYVILLQKEDGATGFYVGQSALTPEERFAQHRAGVHPSRPVQRWGQHLMPEFYQRDNPMTRAEAEEWERKTAEWMRKQGWWVEGGH